MAPSPSLVQQEQQQLAERHTFQRRGINEQPQLQQCQPNQHHQPPAAQPGYQLGSAQGAVMINTSGGILRHGRPKCIGISAPAEGRWVLTLAEC